MSKKTKEIILMTVAGILGVCINAVVISFVYKWWSSIVGLIMMLTIFITMLIAYIFTYIIQMPFLSVLETSYAEFPFEIIYSIDGEVFENHGVIMSFCEPAFEFEYGAHCDYYTQFDKTLDDDILFETEEYKVRIDCGDVGYYLLDNKPEDYAPGQYIYYIFKGQEHTFTLEEAKEEFGIEIISTKFSEPIKNNDYENVIIHYLRELFKGK